MLQHPQTCERRNRNAGAERSITGCNTPYGDGGLGQCLAAVVEELRATESLVRYFTTARRPNDAAGMEVSLTRFRWLFQRTPLRFSSGWRDFVACALFDGAVARLLPAADMADVYVGFSGRALRSFRQARRLGYRKLVLESPTSHVAHVRRQHRAAARAYPIEESWMSDMAYRKMLREYEEADEIVVLSEYARETFLQAGIPATKLRRRKLRPAARFAPPARRIAHEGFRIVYSGRLQVTKGIPVLLDALSRIPDPSTEVVLIGGTATRAMDRYLRARQAADPRIVIDHGDPLPYLHRADVLVHPSFEDGFAFAPAEALATGIPVIVTEDTGMKEYVKPKQNGYVIATGDVSQLVEAIRDLRAAPLCRDICMPFTS